MGVLARLRVLSCIPKGERMCMHSPERVPLLSLFCLSQQAHKPAFHCSCLGRNGVPRRSQLAERFPEVASLCGADKLKSFWESHPSAEPMSRMAFWSRFPSAEPMSRMTFRNRFLPFGSLPLRLLLGYLRCEGSLCHAVLTYEGITLHGTYSVTER